MNNYLKYTLLGVGVVLLQTMLTPVISIWGWTPDMVLILLFILAMHSDITFMLFFAFALGLLQDLFHTDLWGLSSFTNVIAVYVASMFKNFHFSSGMFFLGLTITVIVKLLIFYLIVLAGANFSLVSYLFKTVLPNAIYTITLGIFAYILFKNVIANRLVND